MTYCGGKRSTQHQLVGSETIGRDGWLPSELLRRQMTALVGFPLGTVYLITNITQGTPGVVTLLTVADPNSFAVANGMTITISKVEGMYQINGKRYIVGNFDSIAQTFSLYTIQGFPVNTSAFLPYAGGGEINIISYNPPPGQPPGLMYNNQ